MVGDTGHVDDVGRSVAYDLVGDLQVTAVRVLNRARSHHSSSIAEPSATPRSHHTRPVGPVVPSWSSPCATDKIAPRPGSSPRRVANKGTGQRRAAKAALERPENGARFEIARCPYM